jgi:hypothetical protein
MPPQFWSQKIWTSYCKSHQSAYADIKVGKTEYKFKTVDIQNTCVEGGYCIQDFQNTVEPPTP